MKKQIILLAALLMTGAALNAQVGVGTDDPKATLEIVGETTANVPDGVLVPRFTVAELSVKDAAYGADQNGALVFVTSGVGSAGKTSDIAGAGFHYYDHPASKWVAVAGTGGGGGTVTADNGLTKTGDNIELGGPLIKPTTISNVTGTNKFAITGTGVDAINFDNNTLSIDATNNRVGIGTASPGNLLHLNGNDPLRMEGVTTGNVSTDLLLGVDNTGVVKTIATGQQLLDMLSVPVPAIFSLDSTINDFLDGVPPGAYHFFPMVLVKNQIQGLTYNPVTGRVTIPAGTYQFSFVYEALHNTNCTISSYFVDFPNSSGGNQRIHNTASHATDGLSNHGGIITYTTTFPATRTMDIHLGRGQSGNCEGPGMSLIERSTHMVIMRLGS